jgi:hypothetical protein
VYSASEAALAAVSQTASYSYLTLFMLANMIILAIPLPILAFFSLPF